MVSRNICIVTPDSIGPVNNGGIGTHVHYLARALAACHRVTVLYTGPVEHKNAAHWRAFYKQWGVSFEVLRVEKRNYVNMRTDVVKSLAVYEWLRDKYFDAIHFQDWKADGFHSIQAKRTLGVFSDCLLTVTMHSNIQWMDGGMKQWAHPPLLISKLTWMERYCHRYCDLLLSPSQHMFDWAQSQGWELSENRRIQPNCFMSDLSAPNAATDLSHLVFFGRLETRKGLEIFCEALSSLLAEGYEGVRRVTFMGRHHKAGGQSSAAYLKKIAKQWRGRIQVEVKAHLDSFQARDFLQQSGAVAVIPSLLDNFPYTVVECVELGLPFIASNAGGIGEIAGDAVLFSPTVPALAAQIKKLPALNFAAIKHKYNAKRAGEAWLELHDENCQEGQEEAARTASEDAPLASICVPYYNYGQYLPQLLASISENDYQNYEVIVVNDGSTDSFSNKIFDTLSGHYPDWTFYKQKNGGIGQARNRAASLAKGEYLIFMDSDNCAAPKMISTFVRAIRHSGADCLTCHFAAFSGEAAPGSAPDAVYRYAPYGPCLEAGMLENVFGDANFIIKKTVFEELGGFGLQRDASWEDYAFLADLCLSGHTLEVIPEELFWYRHTEEGFSRVTNLYNNHLRIVEVYRRHLPGYMNFMMKNWIVPSYYASEDGNRLWRLIIKIFPPDTARGRLARAVYKFLKTRSWI